MLPKFGGRRGGQTDSRFLRQHRPINTFQGMGFHYRFSRGDRVQIISGKHKGATGTVDANVFQRSVDFPKDHLPCHHVLLDSHLVITINVNQVEALDEFGRRQGSP